MTSGMLNNSVNAKDKRPEKDLQGSTERSRSIRSNDATVAGDGLGIKTRGAGGKIESRAI